MASSPALPTSSRALPGGADAPNTSGRTAEGAFDVVVMVASLGGPEAVREIVRGLPTWFPAALLVVQHRAPAAQHLTVELLRRSTPLPVALAREHDRPTPGVVHVLPADRQLALGPDGRFTTASGVQRFGHSADALFTSVAERFGHRALGVVLSGTNDDGAAGVIALKRAGGRVLAQNRATARCFGMPAATMATGCVDLVLPVERIAHALISLTAWPGAASLLRAPMAPWAVLD